MKDFYGTHGKTENRIKTLKEKKNSLVMEHETSTLMSDCVTNIQSDTIIHNKT
jgi:hypothetical protein